MTRAELNKSFIPACCSRYLNSSGDEYDGGALAFLCAKWKDVGERDAKVLERVVPEAGMGVLFDQALLHEGERLSRGIKYILRTDVLYRAAGVPRRFVRREPEVTMDV